MFVGCISLTIKVTKKQEERKEQTKGKKEEEKLRFDLANSLLLLIFFKFIFFGILIPGCGVNFDVNNLQTKSYTLFIISPFYSESYHLPSFRASLPLLWHKRGPQGP